MSESRRRFIYSFAIAGGALTFARRSLMFAQREISAEEAAVQAKNAIARQKAALDLVRIANFVAASGNTITTINDRGQSEQLTVDVNVAVWKGKYSRGLQALDPGDRIMARGRKDPGSGKLIVTEIWANWDSFSGTITSVSNNRITVELDRKILNLKRLAEVTYNEETTFVSSLPEDLLPGRPVTVAGLVMKDGTLKATTVSVFDESGRPVRMPPGARIVNP